MTFSLPFHALQFVILSFGRVNRADHSCSASGAKMLLVVLTIFSFKKQLQHNTKQTPALESHFGKKLKKDTCTKSHGSGRFKIVLNPIGSPNQGQELISNVGTDWSLG